MQINTAFGEKVSVVVFEDDSDTSQVAMSWETENEPLRFTVQLSQTRTPSLMARIQEDICALLMEKGVLMTMFEFDEAENLPEGVKAIFHKTTQ